MPTIASMSPPSHARWSTRRGSARGSSASPLREVSANRLAKQEQGRGCPETLVSMRVLVLTAAALLLAGCSSTADPSPTASSPAGEATTGVPSPSTSDTATSPAAPGELAIPALPGEIARSVFGVDQADVVSGDAVEGLTLEARVACLDPEKGTASFEVLDARVDSTGELNSVMSGRLECDGTEIVVATTSPFSGPMQITFRQVPTSAVEGYAILSTD